MVHIELGGLCLSLSLLALAKSYSQVHCLLCIQKMSTFVSRQIIAFSANYLKYAVHLISTFYSKSNGSKNIMEKEKKAKLKIKP